MKNDHNLDDLIIDDIKPVKSKGKGVLTIIALLIILFIVAIAMTRLFLGDSDQNSTMIEQTQEELISPELRLDTTEHDADADKKELEQLSSMMEETLTDEKDTSPKAPAEPSQPQDTQKRAPEKEAAPVENTPQEPKAEAIKPETTTVSEEPKPVKKPIVLETVEKPAKRPAPQVRKPAPKPAAPVKKPVAKSGSYYIQVGSFTQKPSSRFLSVITNSGFRYILKGGKLLVGPYSSDAAARRDLPRGKSKINKGAFVKHL
jgi:DedD protein